MHFLISYNKKQRGFHNLLCLIIYNLRHKKRECRHRPIFPGRLQPSIFSTQELNYRVRNGNGWNLFVIDTDYSLQEGFHLQN